MLLVVGLGNPGPKYAGNRHNVGFMTVDRICERTKASAMREKFGGHFTKIDWHDEEVVLLRPETYMNLSGESVQKAMTFFKVDLKDVVVVHDELDLPWQTARIKVGGGHAGHNGLRSISSHVGEGYVRVRIGIGRPPHGNVEAWVLSDFDSASRAELPDVIDRAADMVEAIVQKGAQAAMNAMHAKEKKGR